MLADAFAKGFRNLLLPGVIKLLLLVLLTYGLSWLGLAWVMGALLASLAAPFGVESWFVQAAGSVGGGMLAWFLFPLLYPVLVSFFDEQIAERVERSDYPQLGPATPPFWPTLWQDVRFSIKAVLLNVLCLPLYFVPLLGIGLYYGLNGYLLGAQFFRMSAGRRVSSGEAEELLRNNRNKVVIAGVLIMLAATIPLLNLVAPVLGVTVMLHLFHQLKSTNRQQVIPR